MLGVGSVAAGLTMAAVPERIGYATRSLAAAVALLVLATPLLLVDTIASWSSSCSSWDSPSRRT